jgi:5-keto-L-gluconate epimerase
MKLSVAIASEDAAPSAFVVWRGFGESVRKAAAFGYQGVELALKTAGDVEPGALRRLLSKYKMEVSGISTGQVFAASGLYFTHPDAAVRQRAVKVFAGLIELAAEFGRFINIGRVRGFVAEGQSRPEAEKLFLDTAEQVCGLARPHGVTILIEPVNRYEINFINNLDEGAALLGKLACENAGLMPDVFHMNIEDAKIGASLIRHAGLIRYIHLADSNRLAPGQGHLNFDEVFSALKVSGFDGWASIEILPRPNPDTAAAAAAKFILPAIEKHNAGPKSRKARASHEMKGEKRHA